MKESTNTITIVRGADDHFYLHVGEDICQAMNFDEVLGEVARWASRQPLRYRRSIDAIVRRMERRTACRSGDEVA